MAPVGSLLHMHTTSSHTVSSPCPTRARCIGFWSAIVALSLGAFLAFGAGTAGAQAPELEVNALAPEITSSADLALAAFDEWAASGDLGDYLDYAEHRTATARLAARQLGYPSFEVIVINDGSTDQTLDRLRAEFALFLEWATSLRR